MKKLTIHCGIGDFARRQQQHHLYQAQMAVLAKKKNAGRLRRLWYNLWDHEYCLIEQKTIPLAQYSHRQQSLLIHTTLLSEILFGTDSIPVWKTVRAPCFDALFADLVMQEPGSLMKWYEERYTTHYESGKISLQLPEGYADDLYHQYKRLVAQCRYAYKRDQLADGLERDALIQEFLLEYGSEPRFLQRSNQKSVYPQLLDWLVTSNPILHIHRVDMCHPSSSPKLRLQTDMTIRFARIVADHSSLVKLLQRIVLIVVFGYFGGRWIVGTVLLGFLLTWATIVYQHSESRTMLVYDLFTKKTTLSNTMTKLHYLHHQNDARATNMLRRAYEGVPASAYQVCTLEQCHALWQTHNDMVRMLLRFEYDTGWNMIFALDTQDRCRQYYSILGTRGKIDHTDGSLALVDGEIDDARRRFWDGITRDNRRKILLGGLLGGGVSLGYGEVQ